MIVEYTTPDRGEISQHMICHAPDKKITCEICGHKFCERGTFLKHQTIKHSGLKHKRQPKKRDKICEFCGFSSTESGNMNNHIENNHNLEIINCNDCNFKGGYHEIIDHMRMTNHKRIFACKYCDYKAKIRQLIKSHEDGVHNGVKYQCDIVGCDYSASYSGDLSTHTNIMHLKIKYPCEICDHLSTTVGN